MCCCGSSEAELAFLRRSLQGPGADALDDDAQATEVRLRRRRLVARDDDGRLQIDRVAVALVGTWLRPTTGARVALSTGGPLRTIDFFHLQQMTVEHEQEGDEHVFRPHSSGPALARRLGVLAGLAGQAAGRAPRPPAGGAPVALPRDGGGPVGGCRAVRGGRGAPGAGPGTGSGPGAGGALARRGPGGAAAAAAAGGVRGPRGERGAGWGAGSRAGWPVSTGGLRLVQEDRGYWAFSNGPGDGGVDVRPVSATEAGGLLTVLAGAVFRPLPDPASGPAARPGQSER